VKLLPAIAAAAGGLPAPAGGPAGGAKSETVTPEVVKEVMDGLHAVKVTVKAKDQPVIGLLKSVAKQAGVTALFSPGAERNATAANVEMSFVDTDATTILDILSRYGNVTWSVAGRGVIRFEEK
jgi:hypothetical protein